MLHSMAASAPSRLVVGAAIYDAAGRLLAAQRNQPPQYAGLWEFPGGKVEPGETPEGALARECREELGVAIEVGALVGDVEIPIGVLRVYRARLISGSPSPREHRELRWLAPDELDDVPWIDADRPLVDRLRAY
jgi:8-oxo-dGTP diphosphatase